VLVKRNAYFDFLPVAEWVRQFDESISGGSMRGAMLFVAGLFARWAIQVVMTQDGNPGVVMMNHVGISVPNIADAVTYHEEKIGYSEAFRVNDRRRSHGW
jgi:hypothetical protein